MSGVRESWSLVEGNENRERVKKLAKKERLGEGGGGVVSALEGKGPPGTEAFRHQREEKGGEGGAWDWRVWRNWVARVLSRVGGVDERSKGKQK